MLRKRHQGGAARRGTSLSGGALPRADAVLIGIGQMKRILEIDYENRGVVVEPGVTNLTISQAVEPRRLLLCARSLQPDRLHHRRQCRGKFRRAALPEIRPDHQQSAGRRDRAAGRRDHQPGRQGGRSGRLDLLGLVTGSEGLLGVVVEVMVTHSAQGAGDPAPCWPCSKSVPAAGLRRRHHRRRHGAGGDGIHGPARRSTRWKPITQPGYPARRRGAS